MRMSPDRVQSALRYAVGEAERGDGDGPASDVLALLAEAVSAAMAAASISTGLLDDVGAAVRGVERVVGQANNILDATSHAVVREAKKDSATAALMAAAYAQGGGQ